MLNTEATTSGSAASVPASSVAPAAETTLGIAVVGAGHWGPNLIRNFHQRPTSQVLWVVDKDAGRTSQVRSRFPDVTVASDLQPIIDDPRVDAVVIATP